MVQTETIKATWNAGKAWVQTHKKQLAAAGYFVCGFGAAVLLDRWNISGNALVCIEVDEHPSGVKITTYGKKKMGYTAISSIWSPKDAATIADDLLETAHNVSIGGVSKQ